MPPHTIILTGYHVTMLVRMRRLGIEDAGDAFESGKRLVQGMVVAAAPLEGLSEVDMVGRLGNGSIEMAN